MPPRLSLVLALLAPAIVMGAGACAGDPAPAVCPNDAFDACPSSAPTFSGDAAPIIGAHCAKCHVPGGKAEKFPFETYEQIGPFAGDMKLQLETCEMPQAPEPPLTPAQRQAMFGWIACGALGD